jgi:hypothetical protein
VFVEGGRREREGGGRERERKERERVNYQPVNMYCESLEKAQSHTHFSELFLRVFLRLKSAVDQILQVPSADVVAKRLNK